MGISINPLSNAIGSEILGADLSQPVSSEDFSAINSAMKKSLVVVFRGQKLEPNNLLSAVHLFGDTMEQHLTDTLMEGHPEIAVLDSREMPPDKEGKIIPFAGRDWHTDHTNHEIPPKFTALYAVKLPASGGDTSFANMHLAFDSLPSSEKVKLSSLETVNKIEDFAYIDEAAREKFGQLPLHPLIRTHPDTGRKAIYVHPGKLEKLVGREPAESQQLIQNLLEKVLTRDICYRHKW